MPKIALATKSSKLENYRGVYQSSVFYPKFSFFDRKKRKEWDRLLFWYMGKEFGHDFIEVDLSNIFQTMVPFFTEDADNADKNSHDYKIRIGNLKARTRMLYLYDLAAKNKGMVLSTDNYTELLLGFWTLHGDVGDYGMIQSLWKTEVYELSKFMAKHEMNETQAKALLDCVDAVPTDGLGITNSDLDQIGASSYFEVDQILIKMLQNPNSDELKDNKVVRRNKNSEFKRQNPFNIPRELITNESYY